MDTVNFDMSSAYHPDVIDLSIKSPLDQTVKAPVILLKPEPRPAWSILWYRTIWPKLPISIVPSSSCLEPAKNEENDNVGVDLSLRKSESEYAEKSTASTIPITDIATCDGPVHFQRVSNPNFALTVEHRERSSDITLASAPVPTTNKTYVCIYCNQHFKSLFCYQKHKKRHLNPVSVDIGPTTQSLEVTHTLSENTVRTTDHNVQFFPCKNCGSKFPSYYFVHKHKKVCDKATPPTTADQVVNR